MKKLYLSLLVYAACIGFITAQQASWQWARYGTGDAECMSSDQSGLSPSKLM